MLEGNNAFSKEIRDRNPSNGKIKLYGKNKTE